MQHSLCFSEAQLRNICALRQVNLQTEALLERQKEDAKYLLWCAEANLASVSAQSCEPTEAIAAQLQLTDVHLQQHDICSLCSRCPPADRVQHHSWSSLSICLRTMEIYLKISNSHVSLVGCRCVLLGRLEWLSSNPSLIQVRCQAINQFDGLAEEFGEPSAASIQDSVKDYSVADEVSYKLDSIEQYIDKLKFQVYKPQRANLSSSGKS